MGTFFEGLSPAKRNGHPLIFEQGSPYSFREIAITTTATLTIGRAHVCTLSDADYAVTLPTATGNAGRQIAVRARGALNRALTLTAFGSQLIEGSNTRVMTDKTSLLLVCDGTGWDVVSDYRGSLIRDTFVDVSLDTGSFGSFSTFIFNTKISDVNNLFSTATGFYTVPSDGIYQIVGSVRPSDQSTVGVNFGVGVHTSNIDGPWFFWHAVQNTTNNQDRTTYPYSRVGFFSRGDNLRMFNFVDGSLNLEEAGMQIMRIA